jgi:hypothetical protein
VFFFCFFLKDSFRFINRNGNKSNFSLVLTQAEQAAERIAENMSNDEIQRHVSALSRIMLMSSDKTIKREDILKILALQDPRIFPALLVRARRQLLDVFGLGIHELAMRGGKGGSSGLYTLRNEVPFDSRLTGHSTPPDAASQTLLCIVLSLIYSNGSEIKGSDLYDALRSFVSLEIADTF